jgi:NitT/TauT family transport system substrate-binding protein
MPTRGKVFLTFLAIIMLGTAVFVWKDKIFPPPPDQTIHVAIKEEVAKVQEDINKKLLAGDKKVALVDSSAIPPVAGRSDYEKSTKNGKLVFKQSINVWPGFAPMISANNGLLPNDDSVFFKKYGFYLELVVIDNPISSRDLFASGHIHGMWGTLDMFALFAGPLSLDSRTAPIIVQQIDFSSGGDGVVVRGNIRSINDLRGSKSKRMKGVIAQNSPSHFFIMALLKEANVDPTDIDFRWAEDAPAAAKIFANDKSFDFFVGWSPDIYTVTDGLKDTRLLVTTSSANRLIADMWAVRADYYRDHPDIVSNMVKGIFEGMDMVRADPEKAAALMATAFKLPVEDCKAMIGKDGGISTGDAHLTNYRENAKFFLDASNPANFDSIWNRASGIYLGLGAIDNITLPGKVKASTVIAKMANEFKEVRDLSQREFKPGGLYKTAEATLDEILTKPIMLVFLPNSAALDASDLTESERQRYEQSEPGKVLKVTNQNKAALDEILNLIGVFGNAYIVLEGNTDASKKGIVPEDMVNRLSQDRAETVRKALLTKYPTLQENQIRAKGNGWSNPLPQTNDLQDPDANKRANAFKEYNAACRRTEVRVIKPEE